MRKGVNEMEISDFPEALEELETNIKSYFHYDEVRDGIHLSDLTHCITRTFWDKMSFSPPEGQGLWMMMAGTLIEKALLMQEQESISMDGIIASPDYRFEAFDGFGELKTTRMGLKSGEPKFGWPIEWVRRMKGYCFMTGRDWWILITLFLIPATPIAKKFQFDQDELDDFWQGYIIPRRDALREAFDAREQGNLSPPQPFAFNESYECTQYGGCPRLILCEAAKNSGNFISPAKQYHGDMPDIDKEEIK